MEISVLVSSTLLSLLLAIFVFLKNPKSYTNRIFALLAIFLAAYPIFNYFTLNSELTSSAVLWSKFVLLSAIPAGPLYYLFVRVFPNDKLDVSKRVIFVLSAWVVLNSVLAISGLLFSVEVVNDSVSINPGPAIASFGILQASTLLLGSWILFKKYRRATGILRTQLKFITYGITAGFGLTLISTFFMAVLLNNSSLVVFSPFFITIATASVSYSIVRHRLLDIRLVLARAVAYTLLVGVLGLFYTGSVIISTSLFLGTVNFISQIALYTTLTLIVAFTFHPLRAYLENVTDKIFFKGKYDSQVLLSDLTKIMATVLRLDDLTKNILKKLLPEMRVSKGAFVLIEKGKVETVESVGFDKKQELIGTDILSLLEKRKVIYYEEENQTSIKKIMRELDVTVSVPLEVKEGELGVLLLGHKLSGEIYTEQDIKLLEILSPEISIAIQNSKAYEEIRQFNIKLAGEVEKATSDLRHANEKLKELDKLKDEFMSIASHELRTPMTAIKSYVWLALHGKTQERDKKVRTYLDKVFESSERMISMINDMLNVNRIETGRMKLDIIPVSVWKVAEQVKDDLSAKAAEAGVEIIIKKDTFAPLVMSDKDKLIEIYTNLIGNALKFTKKGGEVTITAAKKANMVEIYVSDTGVGIAKENLDKLFKKYGKLNESYATVSSSTGTGLGLYITRQYLEKMGGKIGVDSIQGKGTTFTFSLPIAAGKDLLLHAKEEVQPSGIILNPKLAKDPKFLREVVKAEISQTPKKS